MSLRLDYYGQNDGTTVPNVTLTGDPGTDQATLTAAGFLGGRLMALVGTYSDSWPLIAPCDSALHIPYGALLNGPGEFSGSIGPSGSKKAPIVRAMFAGSISTESFVAAPTAAYAVGINLYCGTGANAGLYTADVPTGVTTGTANPVAICSHVPTASEPWLGVKSLL
jgi:hypothetical protein